MQAALRLARAASVREEVPIGAVIVADGEVLAEAHNETIQRRSRITSVATRATTSPPGSRAASSASQSRNASRICSW